MEVPRPCQANGLLQPRRLSRLVQFTDPSCDLHSLPPLWRPSKKKALWPATCSRQFACARRHKQKQQARVPMPLLTKAEHRTVKRSLTRPRYHEWTHSCKRNRRLSAEQWPDVAEAEAALRSQEQKLLGQMLRDMCSNRYGQHGAASAEACMETDCFFALRDAPQQAQHLQQLRVAMWEDL